MKNLLIFLIIGLCMFTAMHVTANQNQPDVIPQTKVENQMLYVNKDITDLTDDINLNAEMLNEEMLDEYMQKSEELMNSTEEIPAQ